MPQARAGVIAGAGCYLIWGLVPLFFQLIGSFGPSAWEIMAHRVAWGVIAAGLLVLLARQGGQVAYIFRSPKTLAWLTLSAVLIAINWVLFIWSVNHARTLESSLGYYILPLINVAAGAVLFRERIGRFALVAIGLAAVGVVLQGFALGHVPLISLAIAVSFGGYGIIRKQVKADAQAGLFVECLVLVIPALVFIGWLQMHHEGHFTASPAAAFWLIASGPVTAAPLALFAWAARRIPLSTMGFLQFLSPTISFIIGAEEGEALTPLRAASFVFIWAGAGLFAYGAWRAAKRGQAVSALAETPPTPAPCEVTPPPSTARG
jgi:chloramphenicol-sensitive protein RarD